MTTVYCVFRQSVYRHDCVGVFSTKRMAKAVAEAAADTEHDGHHSFVVVPFELDAQVRAVEGGYHDFAEQEPVYSVRNRNPEDDDSYCYANHKTGKGECKRVSEQRLAGASWARDP